jgi:hypothetical protein
MPMRFERDDARRRIVVTAAGEFTFDAWRETVDRQVAEGVWDYPVLQDARELTEPGPRTSVIQRMADYVRELTQRHGRRGPVAILVARSDVMFGNGRMYSQLTESAIDVEVFDDYDAADLWLDAAHTRAANRPHASLDGAQ